MTPTDSPLDGVDELLPALRDVYRDIHCHPELSMQEQRTASIAASSLQRAGYDVTTGCQTNVSRPAITGTTK